MEDYNKINQIFLELERLKIAIGRIESHIESESGTISRETNRLMEEINKVEADLRNIIYDPNNGFIVRIDRLMQESEGRKKTKQQIMALWVAVAGILIKIFIDFISNKG